MIHIKHRYNITHKRRGPRSITSITEPNQAPDLRYIINQVSQGRPVSVLEMRADNDATLDDIDLRYTSTKHLTSETIDSMLKHLQDQKVSTQVVNQESNLQDVSESTKEG